MDSKRKWCQLGKTLGILFMLGPIFSLFGTAFEVWRSSAAMGDHSINDPRLLSDSVHGALVINALGITLLPIGIIVFLISVRCDRRWRLSVPPSLPPQAA